MISSLYGLMALLTLRLSDLSEEGSITWPSISLRFIPPSREEGLLLR
jgi:hypothetical protein